MNRYDIKNLATEEITHSYEAMAPMVHHSEWGTLEWMEQLIVDEELMEVVHPQTYEVIVTNITSEYALKECHIKRASEYPPITEFADAFVKLQGGDESFMEDYVAACLAVKAKYPKP